MSLNAHTALLTAHDLSLNAHTASLTAHDLSLNAQAASLTAHDISLNIFDVSINNLESNISNNNDSTKLNIGDSVDNIILKKPTTANDGLYFDTSKNSKLILESDKFKIESDKPINLQSSSSDIILNNGVTVTNNNNVVIDGGLDVKGSLVTVQDSITIGGKLWVKGQEIDPNNLGGSGGSVNFGSFMDVDEKYIEPTKIKIGNTELTESSFPNTLEQTKNNSNKNNLVTETALNIWYNSKGIKPETYIQGSLITDPIKIEKLDSDGKHVCLDTTQDIIDLLGQGINVDKQVYFELNQNVDCFKMFVIP